MKVTVDFNSTKGKMKPMHAVNNGPVYKFAVDQRITNIDHFKAAGIPYARTHDASFYSTYGGEHTVDVHAIFPNFDADPTDPASYDFPMTDEYMKVMEYAGVRPFYRLGSKIEHGVKKYGTLPPKDFHKWAVICEHIIRHYTEGWADGFRYEDMIYWEIWNEPDLDSDDSTHKRCWGGTKAQFFELYEIAAKHLKECFPHLKIGGPAICGKLDWGEDFIRYMAERNVPLDFFSWHRYYYVPEKFADHTRRVRKMLDENGYTSTESILNEWNYVRGWEGETWIYSLKAEKSLKGAAFVAAVMETCQYEPLDMLMYYDARPCGMNGMFSTDMVCDKLKGYYPFYMFNQLYRLGEAVKTVSDDGAIYACAAANDNEAAVMVTHYSDDDTKESVEVAVDLSGFGGAEGSEIEYYLLDENRDAELVGKATYFGDRFIPMFTMTNLSTYLIKIRNK